MPPTKKSSKKPRRAVDAPPEEGLQKCILSVARRLFSEKGLDGVSVREISKKARCNVSLISYYFGGKDRLYKTILENHVLELKSLWKRVLDDAQGEPLTKPVFIEQVHAIIGSLVDLRLRSQEMSQIMQRERLNGLPHCRHIYEDVMAQMADEMVGLVDRAKTEGLINSDVNTRTYFICLIESVFGYFALHDVRVKIWKDAFKFPQDKEKFIDLLTMIYTQGVLR